jgi:predicted Zn-dependent peptidase
MSSSDKFSELFAELYGVDEITSGGGKSGSVCVPKIHTFPNGFRIIHEKPQSSIPVTAINIFCDVGSIFETNLFRGISHFIEHMCFKGTTKVPVPRDIFLKFDKHGAYFNAVTDKRFTYYVVEISDEFVEEALSTLGDMMLNSTFPTARFKREEKVVVEENIRTSDNPFDILFEMVDAVLYRDTPVAAAIDTLAYHKRPFDRADVLKFYDRFYRPQNMILSIVSNRPFAQIVKCIGRSDFAKRRASTDVGRNPSNIQIQMEPLSEPQWLLREKPDLNTAHISIGFRTCSCFSKDRYALDLLRNILSSSFSSRLFTILREKNGLTYSSSASTTYYECGGDFSFYVEVDRTKIMNSSANTKGVIPILVDLVRGLKKGDVTSDEMSLAKDNMRGKMLLHQKNINNACYYNGKELMILSDAGKLEPAGIVPYSELYARHYKDITLSDVNAVIQRYFVANNMVVGIVASKLPKLADLKRVFVPLLQL